MPHHCGPTAGGWLRACLWLALIGTLPDTRSMAQTDDRPFRELARVSFRLGFLQRTWQRDVVEHNPVMTQVLDAHVTGQQTTSVSVRLSCQSDPRRALLNLCGTGQVSSHTQGRTREAVVRTRGDHTFQVRKLVVFDGHHFRTRSAWGNVQARTEPMGVRTIVSGLPLFGPLGDQIAWSETLRRQPVTNSIVARQVADDVFPQFDQSVDRELASANRSWARVRRQVAALVPQYDVDWQASSTDDGISLQVGIREPSGTHIAARPLHHRTLRPDPQPREDLIVTLSDGLINELLAQLPLAGQTVTDGTLTALGELQVDDVVQDGSMKFSEAARQALTSPEVLFSIQLADSSPLEVRFSRGQIEMAVRFRVIPRVGQKTSMHRLLLTLQGDRAGQGLFAMQLADVDVVNEDESTANSGMTQLIRTQTQTLLQNRPPMILPRRTPLQKLGMSDLDLATITSSDGVLRLAFRLAPPAN